VTSITSLSTPFRGHGRFVLPALLVVLAHLAIWLAPFHVVKACAALVLAGFLPGLLLVELLLRRSASPPGEGETLLYGAGLGYGVIVLVMLLLSYLPGGIEWWMTFITFDALLLVLLVLYWLKGRTPPANYDLSMRTPPPRPSRLPPMLLVGVVVLLLAGGYLRFANLGYAEFHSDEARGALRAAAVIQGDEDVLFLHKKGPTEILLPALILSMSGHLDEATARLPLAIAGLAALFAVWLLGWRLINPLAGWLAAWLLAFDGYLIAFARFLQYQSVVLLTGVLVVAILVRLWRQPKATSEYLTLAAILFATGLLSHYDALSVVVPVLFLLALLLWQRLLSWPQLLRSAAPGLLVGGGMLALFYLPYLLHPNFAATINYLIDQRFVVGQRFPYNGLFDQARRALVYNSSYYVTLQVVLTALALLFAYRRGWERRWGSLLSGVLILLMAGTIWRTTWLRFGELDLAVLPFAVALLLVWLAPRLRAEERLLWVWFGALFLVTFFGMALARTHIYVFFAPWALLMAAPLADGWQFLSNRFGRQVAAPLGGLVVAALTLLFAAYPYWYFVYTEVEVLQTWPAHAPRGYWTPPFTKEVDSLYGFPLANGWKVVGALYDEGVIEGDYETNQRYIWIPHWYTLGAHRCGSTATWYFAVDTLESWSLRSADVEDMLEEQGYARWGQVTVQGAPRMVIYRQIDGAPPPPVQTFALEGYADRFDAAAQATMPLISPVIEPPIPNPMRINFGNDIWLEGYSVEGNQGLKPGDHFRLTLYWRAQRNGLPAYKVFNQAYYGDGVMVAQKDAIPTCDREPTNLWSPGDLIVDVHDIPVAADAPPGVYPLFTGLYAADTLVRVPVLDEAGNAMGDHVHLADLEIAPP
jgi:hypothetical protein